MGFSLLPREDEYFTFFSQMGAKIEEAANLLVEMLEHGPDEYEVYIKRIKDVEHECDRSRTRSRHKLNKSFITPFDREDIYTLVDRSRRHLRLHRRRCRGRS